MRDVSAQLFFALLGFTLFLSSAPADEPAAATRPNVVLLIADDVSWDDWGCYGNASARTPHIDALAARGRRFDRAYLTASSCSPSRASIITGRYPHNCGRAGELHLPIAGHLPWFPGVLREAGYFTALVGKNHLSAEPPADGDKAPPRAFDVVDAGKVPGNGGGHGRWVETLRQRPRDRPFFFWLASYDAHRDWDADGEWREEAYGPAHDPRRVCVPAPLIDDATTRSDLASYHNEVSRFDYFVGRVVEELERQNVLHTTCIIVMADNGRPFPGAKTRLNEAGMRTPLVVHWPQAIKNPGTATKSLVSAIDIAPTVLAAAGVTQPVTMQGVSFLPVLHDPAAIVRGHAFSEQNWHDYEAHGRAVRSGGYLYIRNQRPHLGWQGAADTVRSEAHRSLLAAQQAGTISAAGADVLLAPRAAEELYSIDDDPDQVRNLVAEPAQRAVLDRLRGALDEWSEATRDSCPANLSRDAYDRQTGAALPIPEESFRGTPPGSERDAAAGNAPGLAASAETHNLVENGADPTGRRDSTPAFERIAARAAGARHVHIVIPAGAYRLQRRVLLSATGNRANYGLRISGAGEDVTELLVDNPDGGLSFRGVGLNRLSCTISDLSLVAMREDAGVALAFETANPGDHHARQFTAERVLIRGERFDRGNFSSGVEVRNAWYPAIRDVKVTSPYGPQAASPSPLECGILLEDCYSPLLNACYVWGGRRGLVHSARHKRPEDGIVRDSYFVGCEEGIVVDLVADAAHWPEPGFHISDCHVNYRDRGIVFKGVRQATIDTSLFYCHDRTGTRWWKQEQPSVAGGDATTPRPYEPRDIDLVHASDIVISHNIFTEPANPRRVAIAIGRNSGHVLMSANQFNLGGVAIRNESKEPSHASGNVFGGKPDWAARLVRYEDPAGSLQSIDFSPRPRP